MIDTKKIKGILPRRYSKELQERIYKRVGKMYSLSMISQVMRDNPIVENRDIIEEAVLWAKEIKERAAQTAEIAANL